MFDLAASSLNLNISLAGGGSSESFFAYLMNVTSAAGLTGLVSV